MDIGEKIADYLLRNGQSKEWIQVVSRLGSVLNDELQTGGYLVMDVPDGSRIIDGWNMDALPLNLYEIAGQSYAVYSRKEVEAICTFLGLKPDCEGEEHLFTVFPVSSFMALFEDLLPECGLLVATYGPCEDSITIDDTDFYTGQWFENWNEHKEGCQDPKHLAQSLMDYVNSGECHRFDDYECVSQLDAFCALTGYPKKEDYFGVLSDRIDYERLLVDGTYISFNEALEQVNKELVKEEVK